MTQTPTVTQVEDKMRRMWLLSLIVALSLGTTSCKWLKLKLGIGYVVENPEPGTPEAVMQKVLKALSIKDENRSWQAFLKLLHSKEKQPGYISSWKRMKFPPLRRKVHYYILDPSKYSYKLKAKRPGLEGTIKLYLYNPNTDVPTPCKFKRDPKAGGAWRVYSSCL